MKTKVKNKAGLSNCKVCSNLYRKLAKRLWSDNNCCSDFCYYLGIELGKVEAPVNKNANKSISSLYR
jgi:hypothetical protein